MPTLLRIGLAIVCATTLPLQASAQALAKPELASEVSQGLTAFNSDEGLARLARSAAKANFAALANQFEAQSNAAFCGPTSAAIVLNAVRGRSPDLPRDRSRLRADDLQYLPSAVDPSLPRFTQDNVISRGAKTRAQVMGQPVTIDGKQVRDVGYQVRQFDEMLVANELRTRLVIANEKTSDEAIRRDLVESLGRRGDFAIVNYSRRAVGQEGGGHISPLGAYDAASDSFLVLDVNPTSAGWVWMPATTLVKGMRTFDTVENRGYVLVEQR
jgi:hypothetical protein